MWPLQAISEPLVTKKVFPSAEEFPKNRQRHVHVKDHAGHLVAGAERRYLHSGEVQIDFRCCVQQLKTVGFDGALSLEARAIDHNGQVEIARIQTSLHFLRSLIAKGETHC